MNWKYNYKKPEWFPKFIEMQGKERFLVGTQNTVKIKKALGLYDNRLLAQKTLLDVATHKKHAASLDERFQRRWKKSKDKYLSSVKIAQAGQYGHFISEILSDHELANTKLRFLTIVHSVVELDSNAALRDAAELKNQLISVINQVSGLACLGALELEVISIKQMRRLRELSSAAGNIDLGEIESWRQQDILNETTKQEHRKLEVCEALGAYLDHSLFAGESGQFLVHFHGIVAADKEQKLEQLKGLLKSNKNWSAEPRQIELKKLSEQFAGKPKSVERNLRDIATYITKGGNDWHAGKAYMRYKVRFQNGLPLGADEWASLNWRTNELLRKEHKEEGIVDISSLNSNEINELALAIDGMMNWNTTRTGYLVTVGRW